MTLTLTLTQTLTLTRIALPLFYATYYGVAAILSAALGTRFTGLEPFEHEAFTPAADTDNMRPLAVWLAMVLSFSFFGGQRRHFQPRPNPNPNP